MAMTLNKNLIIFDKKANFYRKYENIFKSYAKPPGHRLSDRMDTV